MTTLSNQRLAHKILRLIEEEMKEGYLLRDDGRMVFDVRVARSSLFLRRISDGVVFKMRIDEACQNEFPEYGEIGE